jgi:hypothetical protein
MISGLKACGEFGHLTKAGKPCGYKIRAGATACLHHSQDKAAQRSMLDKAVKQRREATIPDIETNGFATIEDCLKVRTQIVRELTEKKVPDLRRLDLVLKAANGASADHAVKAAERTNELLLQLNGHGAGIAMLQRLREAPLRVLPGKRKALDVEKVLDLAEALKPKEPAADTQPVPSTTSTTPTEPQEA